MTLFPLELIVGAGVCLGIAKVIATSVHPKTDAKPKSSDRETFEAFPTLVPESCIRLLRSQPFESRFPWDSDAVLLSFLQRDNEPGQSFADPEIELLRRQFHEAVELLVSRIYEYSSVPPTEGGISPGSFRSFWKRAGEDVADFEARRNEVIEAAKRVCSLYDEFVLAGRGKFGTRGRAG